MKKQKLSFLAIILLFSFACTPSFQEFNYGKDACAFCKMTIMDANFASEVLTHKGRAYKFDDISCMKKYIQENNPADFKQYFVVAHNHSPEHILDAENATYLHHPSFKSPMNGNYAAYPSLEAAQHLIDSLNPEILTWENIE